jgi:Hypothetical protein (DUF2513)
MKRDMNLIRDLLLEIEAKHDGSGRAVDVEAADRERAEVVEHLFMLDEAGFIEARDASSLSGREILVLRLTWHGHEFLNSIRDPDIWQKTEKAATTAGSWTLGLLKDLATAYARQKLAEVTGVTL